MAIIGDDILQPLIQDITSEDILAEKDDITRTISDILHEYNLNTDKGFIEKIATMKFDGKETISFDDLPNELRDAAFLPVNTIADIALRQDLDLVISQLPEWYTALTITRDAICEADIVDGKLSRDITFDHIKLNDLELENTIAKIEDIEEKLDLDSIIKNHIVFNTLEYGEGYIYAIPYAKVFSDLYKYRLSNKTKDRNSINMSMNETSSILNGYGFGESAIEVSLNDTIVNDSTHTNSRDKKKKNLIFTESEIIEINPSYGMKPMNDSDPEATNNAKKQQKQHVDEYDAYLEYVAKNIRYIQDDIALPVIEESAHDLRCVYNTKYHEQHTFVQEVNNVFDRVMNDSIYMEDGNEDDDTAIRRDTNMSISPEFENIKGIYLKILPGTKLIPIRVDRIVIGYYYISDLTRPEEAGERKNSGMSGYTLRSPSVGYDTFSPDRMFCEKLATKIINNFNLKFMKDNISLHQQIVSILQSHKFNEAMMRFVFIPAEHVIQCTINKDGMGKGHSMLEPGLVTARMYMFLKLYTVLYQINNSNIRVYNVRMSGIDKNYKQFIQETMRKFASRRVTATDIFNYRSSMTKVTGSSELIMPLGAGDQAPVTVDNIPAAESPINLDLLNQFKNEAINSTPVPSLMVQTGGESQIEFAKETELANTRFNTMISSYKIDFNRDITRLYRLILRWESDINVDIIMNLRYRLRMPTAKTLNVTVEMINNFNALVEIAVPIFLHANEISQDKKTEVVRQFTKRLLHKYIPQIDIVEYEEMANEARNDANIYKLEQTSKSENILDEGIKDEDENPSF